VAFVYSKCTQTDCACMQIGVPLGHHTSSQGGEEAFTLKIAGIRAGSAFFVLVGSPDWLQHTYGPSTTRPSCENIYTHVATAC